MRAATIVIAAMLALLGAPAGADWQRCYTQSDIAERFLQNFSDGRVEKLTADDTDAVARGVADKVGYLKEAQRVFLVGNVPLWPGVRIWSFVDGCVEDYVDVSHDLFLSWTRQEAGQ